MMRAIAGRGGTEAIPVCLSVYDNVRCTCTSRGAALSRPPACLLLCCLPCLLSSYLSISPSLSVRRLAKVKNIQQAPPAYPSIHRIRPEIDR